MSESPKIETTVNKVDPSDTRVWVLIPTPLQPLALQPDQATQDGRNDQAQDYLF
jgi:hypothetical protein